METAIKRNLFDPILQTQLHRPSLLDRHINVLCVAVHQVLMNDKARGIFIHQQQTTELHRLSSFAAFVKLCVRFKDAEQLVFVGNRFAEQHATPSREQIRDSGLQGGDRRSRSHDATLKLADLGVTKQQAHRWRRVAHVSAPDFEQYFRQCGNRQKEITGAGLLRTTSGG